MTTKKEVKLKLIKLGVKLSKVVEIVRQDFNTILTILKLYKPI